MTRTLAVSDHEHRAIVSGLLRLRNNVLGLHRRYKAKGWQPEKGKQDVQLLRLETIDKLLARIAPDALNNRE